MYIRAILLGSLLLATSAANAETYYCPWADMVIKLTFSPDRTKVEISDVVEAEAKPSSMGKILAFQDRSGDFAYDYEFKDMGGLGHTVPVLTNRRVDLTTGRVLSQSGYCMDAKE